MIWYGEADALRCVQHARGGGLVCARRAEIKSVLMRSLSRSINDCGGMYVFYGSCSQTV